MSIELKKVFIRKLMDTLDNDFKLSDYITDYEERKAFVKRFHELNGDPEVFEEDLARGSKFEYLADYHNHVIMSHHLFMFLYVHIIVLIVHIVIGKRLT